MEHGRYRAEERLVYLLLACLGKEFDHFEV